MIVKILGSGCSKCQTLEVLTRQALDDLGLDVPIEHVRDAAEIASYGVMSTPALVVDDAVVIAGRVPAADQVRTALSDTICDD